MRAPTVLVVALALAACGGSDAPAAEVSATAPAATTTALTTSGVTPEGFGRVAARVTAADGERCELCVWLADTGDRRQRGLMGVTELGAADAMAFVYPAPATSAFWMKDTRLALSIAFYAADGAFLDSFDMQPCAAEPCPTYPTPTEFTVAVEVPQGTLADFLMGPGSVLEVTDLPCE
jgi:uncharacterized membrane protein (UPF0127 family)